MSECCGVPCGEYLFDHRNGSMLREWFIDTFVGGPHGIDNPAIDGFFFDDNYGGGGASEEDPHNVEDCGLSESEKQAVADGWKVNTAAVGQAVLAKGGFAVPFFTLSGRNESSPEVSCQRDMQRMCNRNATTGRPDLVDQALLFEFSRVDHKADVGIWHPNGSLPYFEQDLATFMLVRGAHAWMGYTWSGCTDSGYPSGCGKHSRLPFVFFNKRPHRSWLHSPALRLQYRRGRLPLQALPVPKVPRGPPVRTSGRPRRELPAPPPPP